MAKICRARYLGEQANKVVAIKMVQPQFSNDEAFVRMFQDELNITFGMLHPNIMQVYDYGKTNGQLYTAMEYIHGANLKQYLDRTKETGKPGFPPEVAVYIMAQVCQGLHYAHTFTDKLTGKPFNIVHRDISPHNIMLTYDGSVKVIDFGIAKANTNSEATQAGTIKGKLSYLAPEYLEGLELDARYDMFAVGLTLWELLTGEKVFQAKNDLAVLKQIQACKIEPASSKNPKVKPELDKILEKALSKDRNKRFKDMDEFNRELVKFLYKEYASFNSSDLKKFAEKHFEKDIERDRQKFIEYGKIDIVPYIEDMKREESRTGKIASPTAAPKAEIQGRTKVRELEMKIENSSIALEIDTKPERTGTRKLNKTMLQSAKVNSRNAKVNTTATVGKRLDRDKSNSRIMRNQLKDAEETSGGSFKVIAIAISLAVFCYFQADMVESFTGFNLKTMIHGADPARTIATVPKQAPASGTAEPEAAPTHGKIILGGFDATTMELYVDGNRTQYLGKPIQVNLNQNVSVMVKRPGYLPYSTSLNLDAGKNSMVVNIPPLQKTRTGLLTTSQNYTAGSKLVYEVSGELVSRDLPFRDVAIPEGTYQAKVVNPILNTEKRVEFTIQENKKHFLE
jgi:serine/threonine-protein kinase